MNYCDSFHVMTVAECYCTSGHFWLPYVVLLCTHLQYYVIVLNIMYIQYIMLLHIVSNGWKDMLFIP